MNKERAMKRKKQTRPNEAGCYQCDTVKQVAHLSIYNGRICFPLCKPCIRYHERQGTNVREMAEKIVRDYMMTNPAFQHEKPVNPAREKHDETDSGTA
jgi:hypothetical protein